MERNEAFERLNQLQGQDLVELASHYGVTIWTGGKKNKGWAGHVIERYLGLQLNSSQSPNFGSWELKIVPLYHRKSDGKLVVKETMAITMIDPRHVVENDFEHSHLLTKLRRAIVCARIFESQEEKRSILHSVATFDLDNPELFNTIRDDYEAVRSCIIHRGFEALSGRMGQLIQPRTKGMGHGSTTRAFYARKALVAHILGI